MQAETKKKHGVNGVTRPDRPAAQIPRGDRRAVSTGNRPSDRAPNTRRALPSASPQVLKPLSAAYESATPVAPLRGARSE